MDGTLLENINNNVDINDVLYHLGDFCLGEASKYREQIKCRNVFIILGNHDPRLKSPKLKLFSRLFTDVYTTKKLYFEDVILYLSHYPFWNNTNIKVSDTYICLHGHCHNKSTYKHPVIKHMDLSVENTQYCPVTLENILNRLEYT
jgi:calcineurin-like phosphoesterase family protein